MAVVYINGFPANTLEEALEKTKQQWYIKVNPSSSKEDDLEELKLSYELSKLTTIEELVQFCINQDIEREEFIYDSPDFTQTTINPALGNKILKAIPVFTSRLFIRKKNTSWVLSHHETKKDDIFYRAILVEQVWR